MPLNQIKTSLFDRLETLVFPAGVTIHYPNVEDTLPVNTYIRPTVLPSNTTAQGIKTTDKEIGTFQVSIFVKKGVGEILAADIAQIILDGFPRNTGLEGVRIEETGSIASSFFDGNWQITPVSIPYINFS